MAILRHKEVRCPSCGHELDSTQEVGAGKKDVEAELLVTICAYCSAPSVYNKKFTALRKITPEEIEALRLEEPELYKTLLHAMSFMAASPLNRGRQFQKYPGRN